MKQQFIPINFLALIFIFVVPFLILQRLASIASHPLPGSPLRFQNIEPQTDLDGTNYVLEYEGQSVVLKDKSGLHAIRIVQGYSPVAAPPAYSRLWYSDSRIYVVTRLASGGNSGANWYRVFKVSANPLELVPNYMTKVFNIGANPLELMPNDADPANGLSCVDPRLNETEAKDALEFERSTNCVDSAAARQSYEIALT